MEILIASSVFVAIVLALVAIILFAKSKLVNSEMLSLTSTVKKMSLFLLVESF